MPTRSNTDAPDGDTSTDLAISGGTFTLQADESFTDTLSLSQSRPGNGVTQLYTTIANGTYTVVGPRLTLTVLKKDFRYDTSLFVGAVKAENLDIYVSFRADGKSFLYRKTPQHGGLKGMIYDPRRAALNPRQRILDSMTPEERAEAGDDSGYTVEIPNEERTRDRHAD